MNRLNVLAFVALLGAAASAEAAPCVSPPRVSITSVSPAGPLVPGTQITINGASFNTLAPAARVRFTSRQGATFGATVVFTRLSDTKLTAFVPTDAATGGLQIQQSVLCSGPTANSSVAIFYTLATGPSLTINNKLPYEPLNRSAVAVSNTEVAFSWYAGNPVDRDGFFIDVSTDFGRTFRRATTVTDPRAGSAVVSGLTSGTTYVFDLGAFGPGGKTFTQKEALLTVTTLGPAPASGSVTISGGGGALCTGSMSFTGMESFFDQNNNQMVDGSAGDASRGSYPFSLEWRENAGPIPNPERAIFSSSSFGRGLGGQVLANLVVVGYFNCRGGRQFVSAHLAVWQNANGGVSVDGITVLVGDTSTQAANPEIGRGVILEGNSFDPMLDARAITDALPRAKGSFTKNVVFSDLGTNQLFQGTVTFNFDVPVEKR